MVPPAGSEKITGVSIDWVVIHIPLLDAFLIGSMCMILGTGVTLVQIKLDRVTPWALLARSQWAPGTLLRGPAEVRPIRIKLDRAPPLGAPGTPPPRRAWHAPSGLLARF